MTTATLTAPRTSSKAADLKALRHVYRPEALGAIAALESLGRKAGIEAHAARLKYYGADWIASGVDADWRSRDAVRAVRELQWQVGRELTPVENGAFVVAMIDVMHDLV